MSLEILSVLFLTPAMIFLLCSYYSAVRENRRGRLIFAVLFAILAGILAPPICIILSFPLTLISLIDSCRLRQTLKKMRKEGMNPEERLREQTTLASVLARHARITGRTLWGVGMESDQPPSYSSLSLPLANGVGIGRETRTPAYICQCGPAGNEDDVDLEGQGQEFGRGTTCHCLGAERLPAYPPAVL